jgi:hypothetical protein
MNVPRIRIRAETLVRAGSDSIRLAEPHGRRAQAQVACRLGGAGLDALIATPGEIEILRPPPAGVN